jgi:hypothetical protein
MAADIVEIVRASKLKKADRCKAFPEGAFLNHYVLPALYRFVSTFDEMNDVRAREALLSESYRSMREYASGTPARQSAHPFEKVIGISPQTVVRRWKSSTPTVGSYPDLALRAPFPYRTVFEAKYFRRGGIAAAETELATNIYQAFFYRGLTRITATKTHPAWDYEYACVLAYDGTEKGTLLQAWDRLRPQIGKACWEGASIYVMIIRGGSVAERASLPRL